MMITVFLWMYFPISKYLYFFALPIATSSILQQLFNSADVAVAGRFAESGALVAVGSNSVLVGLLMMVVGLLLSKYLLVLVDTPEDVLERALLYLRIYCLGMPFITSYNFGAAILRSIGDTKRPLYCLIASGILNICLNLILVIVFHFGVAGVVIATVISNIFSASIVWYMLCHENEIIQLYWRNLRINGEILKKIAKIGAPAALQSAVFSIYL